MIIAKRMVTIVLILFLLCLVSCTEKENDNFFGKLEYPEELYVWAYSSPEPLAPFSYGDKEVIKDIIDMINNCNFEVASVDWNDLANPRFSIPLGEDDYDMRGDGNGNYYFTLSSSDIAKDTNENASEYCDVIYHANGFDYDVFMTLFEKPGDTENKNFFGTLEYSEDFEVSWIISSKTHTSDETIKKEFIDMLNKCDFDEVDIDWDSLLYTGINIPLGEDRYEMKTDENGGYYFSLMLEDSGTVYEANGFDYDVFLKLFEKPGDTE